MTLHILEALIEKCPSDLPLYADSVLTILHTVLNSHDLSLIEETIAPFSAFCRFQDSNILAAEHSFVNHYREVVRTYASFASGDPASSTTTNSNSTSNSNSASSLSTTLRWKTAGLRAIQAVVGADVLGADAMNQLEIVLPPLLDNIYTYSFSSDNNHTFTNEKDNSHITQARIRALEEAERELSTAANRKSINTIDSADAIDAATADLAATASANVQGEAANAEKALHDLAANANGTDDADKTAETAVRALALGCLQKIFASGSNTAQIKNSTAYILRFIVARQPDWTTTNNSAMNTMTTNSTAVSTITAATGRPTSFASESVAGCSWGRHLLAIIARSTPVQNRFIILLAAMESLLNTPMSTRKMPAQLMLASLIDGLLSGPNNLIGLSVMDVLIGLLQHLLLLLRVTSGKTKRVLHRQTTSGFVRHSLTGVDGDGLVKEKAGVQGAARKRTATIKGEPHGRSRSIALTDEDAISDPERRAELANLLQLCIGHLATHIYYADQVSDIITMILSRIKPTSSVIDLSDSTADANAQADKGPKESTGTAADLTTNGTSTPDLDQERLFSFPEAQISALRSVKNVLSIANAHSTLTHSALPLSSSVGPNHTAPHESRNKVSIAAWEDTQWMLRDTDIGVQIGYIDALVTWLATETTPEDLRVVEPRKKAGTATNTTANSPALNPVAASVIRPITANPSTTANGYGNNATDSSERLYRSIANTVTTAHRGHAAVVASQFLAQLHVAVYDSASISGDGDVIEEANILRLHLVLATLIDKLGVNAIRHALPMIMRLQEDIVVSGNSNGINGDGATATHTNNAAKAVAGSLVHGCLLAIVQRFELYGSPIGREITAEIERRKSEGGWIRGVSIPPLNLAEIDNLAKKEGERGPSALNTPETATFNPFFNVIGLVDLIEESYNNAANQSYHMSSLDGSALGRPSTSASTHSKAWQQAYHAFAQTQPLPASVKDSMVMPWTRDSALAAIDASDLDTIPSLSGSRTNTNLGLSTGPGRSYVADALGHRNGASSSASIKRARAGTTYTSTEVPSMKPETKPEGSIRDGHIARRSVSLRNGKPGSSTDLTRRGSVPDNHRLSVGTTNTIRMNELRRVLSVVNSGSQDRNAIARRHQSGVPGSNLGARRESSSLSSTYSDHPSLISAHSNLPPTSYNDRQFNGDALQTINSVPPVPPIPSDYNTPNASQSSISRPSTARAPHTSTSLVPPQQVKSRSHTFTGTAASNPSSPPKPGNGTSIRTATQRAPIPVPDDKFVYPRTRHSNSIRSDRTVSLGRRADVERLINGLLDHANFSDSGDPFDCDSSSNHHTLPAHFRQRAVSQRPAINTTSLGNVNGSAPTTPITKPSPGKSTPGIETSPGSDAGPNATTPGSGGGKSGMSSFFHDDADFHLSTPPGAMSPQQQREQRAALLAGLGSGLGSSNRDNIVRPPY